MSGVLAVTAAARMTEGELSASYILNSELIISHQLQGSHRTTQALSRFLPIKICHNSTNQQINFALRTLITLIDDYLETAVHGAADRS